ncbi:hypothetical protein QWZ08_01915 [Ferruginibacter paludis]|uniref:hypothetical protein n=1 Tax=Ferruginibacter paludis TaxID=1310417 RepID=UPI0025B38338|nr:hypothetical protein [Ferruginibacter paludis]MDN3654362.1 hypothetical protein [Ferruginibacter paludis]
MLSTDNKKLHKQFAPSPEQNYVHGKTNAYLGEISSLSSYIISVPIVLITCYLFYDIADGDTIIAWGKEDSFFEWLTALGYFVSAVLLMCTFKNNRNIFLFLLAIVLFFGTGEEISWGQRIFGFATPEEINKINVQHEFNIHNMIVFDGKTMDGGVKRGLSRFFEMDLLFKIFTIFFGIVLPLCVYHFKAIFKLSQKFKIPVPPISIGIFFLISWIMLKLSLAAFPPAPVTASADAIRHYWRIYMAGPEIAEFIGSYTLAIICLYFYNYRNKNIMGKDFKQLGSINA